MNDEQDSVTTKLIELNKTSSNLVVILGSKYYKEDILKKIEPTLAQKGYTPIVAFEISENFEEHFTPRQRIFWFLSNSVFIIAEDSIPSGEMLELEYCKTLGATTIILHDKKLPRSSWMTLDIEIHSSNFRCFEYDIDNIEKTISDAISWAISKNADKIKVFNEKHKDWEEKT